MLTRGIMKKTLALTFLLAFAALTTSAQLRDVWKDARFLKAPMNKVMIVSQFIDPAIRSEADEAMAKAFAGKDVDHILYSELFHPYDSMYYYSTMERKLDSAGVDGILVVKMIDSEQTDLNIAPGDVIPPYAYNYYEYYSFFYYHDLPIIIDPNYYRRPGKEFRLDLYLYQNRGDMVVYGGQSKALDPLNPDKAISTLAKKTIKKLLSEDLVAREKN